MADSTLYNFTEPVTPGAVWRFDITVRVKIGAGDPVDVENFDNYDDWELYIFNDTKHAGATDTARRLNSKFGGANNYLSVANAGIIPGTAPLIQWVANEEQSAGVRPGDRDYELWVQVDGEWHRIAHGIIPVVH